MGGWVANSKHDFFSIKNYDIIKGGWVTDFHVIIFKLSFFHKSPYDFPFLNTPEEIRERDMDIRLDKRLFD